MKQQWLGAMAASPGATRALSELQLCCVTLTMKMFMSESCQVLFHRGNRLGVCKAGLSGAGRPWGASLCAQKAHHQPKATLKLGENIRISQIE